MTLEIVNILEDTLKLETENLNDTEKEYRSIENIHEAADKINLMYSSQNCANCKYFRGYAYGHYLCNKSKYALAEYLSLKIKCNDWRSK
jgi:hypothetical protein